LKSFVHSKGNRPLLKNVNREQDLTNDARSTDVYVQKAEKIVRSNNEKNDKQAKKQDTYNNQ